MKKSSKYYFIILAIILAGFSACDWNSDPTESPIRFKNPKGLTGVFELDPNGQEFLRINDTSVFRLKASPSIPMNEFKSLEMGEECHGRANDICVDITFSEKGTKMYASLTKRNLNKQIFFVIDGVIISAPKVMGVIRTGQSQFLIPKSEFKNFFEKNK